MISIPAMTHDDDVLNFENMGNDSIKELSKRGDLFVRIKIKKNDVHVIVSHKVNILVD